jgi:hypothetical protein
MRQGPNSLQGLVSAHPATPSNNRGDLISEPPATDGHEWLCCEGCLVCHRLASSIVKVSNLIAGWQPWETCQPCYHVTPGDHVVTNPPAEPLAIRRLRGPISRVVLLLEDATLSLKADLPVM